MADSNVFVKPAVVDGKAVLVRDPVTGKPLAANGEWKTKNQFWIRRIRDKDVTDATKAQTLAQAPAQAPAPRAPAAEAPVSSFSPSKGPSK